MVQAARKCADLDEAPAVGVEEHRQDDDEPDVAGAEQEHARFRIIVSSRELAEVRDAACAAIDQFMAARSSAS